MRLRDFLLVMSIGLIWGANFVITKLALSGWDGFGGVPPLFLAALRFGCVALVLFWLLRPIPSDLGRVSAVALCLGALHFALMYLGLADAAPSAAAVTMQLIAPFTTVLSVIILGEMVDWRRGLGVGLAFLGVALVAYDPVTFQISFGVVLIAVSALVAALGSVMIKGLKPLSPLRMQAWAGLISAPPLLALSFMLESGQTASVSSGGWGFAAAFVYIVVMASIIGHGGYYYLLRRYDASLIAPQILTAPLWGLVFGVLVLGDPFTWRLALGAVLTLSGVLLIVVRWTRKRAADSGTVDPASGAAQ